MRPHAISRRARAVRPPRVYQQDARARQTEANTDGIIRATAALVRRAPRVPDITLEDIARESGLTVRTILRRFGSRDGALEAAFDRVKEEFSVARVPTTPGDVPAAIASLLGEYEAMGDFNIRILEQEHQFEMLHRGLSQGRQVHRTWLQAVFGPRLAGFPPAERERRITALYAATDVYVWKLLRRDLHLDRDETEATICRLVEGVLAPGARRFKGGK